jgi:hypothetical protein
MATDRTHSLIQVGIVCDDWAYIEHYLEYIIWWELDLGPIMGRVVTAPLDAEKRSRMARDLITKKSTDPADQTILTRIACYIDHPKDLRNLAVHGARLRIGGKTHGIVTRGKWKYTPTPIDQVELDNLMDALSYIVAALDIFIVDKKIGTSAPLPLPDIVPLLLQPCHQPPSQTPQSSPA